MPNWIPIRDRLPPDEVPVICLDPRGFEYTGMYSARVHRDGWFLLDRDGHGFIRRLKPTHWRPDTEHNP